MAKICVVCKSDEYCQTSESYLDVELEEELERVPDNPKFIQRTGYLFCPKCGLVYKAAESE